MNKAITKLESQRLLLIPINNSFCSVSYLSWLNDPEICKYLESGGAYNMVTLNEYIHNAVINNVFFWAICLKSNNKHIGNIKIDPISLRHQRGEYGILIGDKTEWGKGYAKEASDLIIEFCFKKLNLRKITLGVVESNMAAVSLYKKMCFQIEGVYKDHGIYENKVENVLRMAIFNPGFIYE